MTSPESLGQDTLAVRDAPLALEIENVSKEYHLFDSPWERLMDALGVLRRGNHPSRRVYHALNDVSLKIAVGERVGIVGRNGAGKSTLLKLISGNFQPTAGTIRRNGKVLALMQAGLGFHPEFSGLENIRSSLVYNGLDGAALAAATEEIADFVELGDYLEQPLKTYSMGMAARLQFATATAIQPEILIIDELLSAGDAYFAAKCAERVRRITESGCTLLLVSHASQQVIQFCKRAVWIEQGSILMDGPAIDVVGAYEVECQERLKRSNEESALGRRQAQLSAGTGNYSQKKWVAQKIAAREYGGEVAALDTEKKVTLSNGRQVYRWPSEKGIKVEQFRLLVDGVESNVAQTGGELKIEISLAAEVEGKLACRYFCSFFTLDGKRAAWLTSPVDHFDALPGQARVATIDLSPVLLGGGDYVLSISVFDDTDTLHINQARRYDLLARCGDLKVVEMDGRESPTFHYPARWSICEPTLVVGNERGSE